MHRDHWRRAAPTSWTYFALICVASAFTAETAVSQVPSADGVTWSRMFVFTDGRTFVTDGAFMLDSSLVDAGEFADAELIAPHLATFEGYFAADLPDEFALSEHERDAQTFRAPSGVALSARYVDYLRATPRGPSLRLRMKGDFEPVVIVADCNAVGLLMPMKRP
jgi:hypothetical protein